MMIISHLLHICYIKCTAISQIYIPQNITIRTMSKITITKYLFTGL